MTQEQVTEIINTYYSDKIQMGTLTPLGEEIPTDISLLLFKTTEGNLREFKGYPAPITGLPFNTEQDVRNILDTAISVNQDWFDA